MEEHLQTSKPKMKRTTKFIIILISIIGILGIGYIVNDVYIQPQLADYKQTNIETGITAWNNEVINQVNDNGLIPYFDKEGNRQNLPIMQICQEVYGELK